MKKRYVHTLLAGRFVHMKENMGAGVLSERGHQMGGFLGFPPAASG